MTPNQRVGTTLPARPWFGAWPPQGGLAMSRDYSGLWRQYAVERLLAIFVLLGIVFVLLPHTPWMSSYSEEVRGSFGEIGKAFFIAGILGLAIDSALKKDLVREAVAASLGYLLPERLKPELRWLYDQRVMCTQSYDVVLEHIPEKKCVIFHGIVKRRFENFSNEKTVVNFGGGTDDWFSAHGETEITAWSWKLISKDEKNAKSVKIAPVIGPFGIGSGEKPIEASLGPDQAIEVLMAYKLYLAEHGLEFLTHKYMIDRPSITVTYPQSLRVFVTFSHRDRYDQEVRSDGAPVFSFTLERVLLPHQDIKVYWHSAKDVEERMKKHALMQ